MTAEAILFCQTFTLCHAFQTCQFVLQHYTCALNAFATIFPRKIYQIEHNKKLKLFAFDSQSVSDYVFTASFFSSLKNPIVKMQKTNLCVLLLQSLGNTSSPTMLRN